jgi:Lon protease-like protein
MAAIGVFPLALVLVPTERVPLHIFEPRYKELIGECIADETPFGLLLEDDSGRRDIGTLASVAEVLHVFEDGRMNIVAEGSSRFRIAKWTDGRTFPTAEVEPFEDELVEVESGAHVEQVLELFDQLAAVAGAEIEQPDGASGSLTFEIASHVDFGHEPKQELLELRSEQQRLDRLAELLEHALTLMKREREIKERASTNGRVSHG